MRTQRRGIANSLIAMVAVLILVVGVVGLVTLESQKDTCHNCITTTSSSVPSTASVTTTLQVTSTTQSQKATTTSSSYCIQSGIHGELYVRVVADNTNQPVSGANVTATITNYCSPDFQTALGFTNSTGYSTGLGWTGEFVVTVTYEGAHYTFPAQTSGAVSLATLSIPSGVAAERTIACYGLDCLYNVTFKQAGTCNPTIYAPKWSVTLGDETKSAQTNNTASNSAYAEPLPPPPIVFLVTNGVYQYNIGPSNDEFQPSSGTVTVNGADVIITVTGPVTSCTAVASG
jgi:hypothetical protein